MGKDDDFLKEKSFKKQMRRAKGWLRGENRVSKRKRQEGHKHHLGSDMLYHNTHITHTRPTHKPKPARPARTHTTWASATSSLWVGDDMRSTKTNPNSDPDTRDDSFVTIFGVQIAGAGANSCTQSSVANKAEECNADVINIQDMGTGKVKSKTAARCMTHKLGGSATSEYSIGTQTKNEGTKGGCMHSAGSYLSTYRTKVLSDPRGWGRWSGAVYGSPNKRKKNSNTKALAIISIYCPVESDAETGMWKTQLQAMRKMQLAEANPREQFLADLTGLITALKKTHKCNFIIQGDWNMNPAKTGKKHAPLAAFCNQNKLANAYEEIFPGQDPPKTYIKSVLKHINSTTTSWIDHTLVSKELIENGAIPNYGVLQGEQILSSDHTGSDHRAQVLHVNITRAMGLNGKEYTATPLRKRTLKFVNKKQRAMYEQLLNKQWAHHKLEHRIDMVHITAATLRRTGTPKQRAALQRVMDRTMRDAMIAPIQAEDAMRATMLAPSSRKKNGWSVEYVRKCKLLHELDSCCREAKSHKSNILKNRVRRINEGFTYNTKKADQMKLPDLPTANDGDDIWKKWATSAGNMAKSLKKTLHAKQRAKLRLQFDPKYHNSHVSKMEKMRTSPFGSGAFFSYARYRDKFIPAQKSLVCKTKTASGKLKTVVIDEPAKFKQKEVEHARKHMSGTEAPWTKVTAPDGSILRHPISKLDRAGEFMRKETAGGSIPSSIPNQYHDVFRHAKAKPINEADKLELRRLYTTEISKSEFELYLSKKKKNRAPAASEIRIDHVCSASTAVKEGFRKLISIPYLTGLVYRDWRTEIINWIPKEAGNPDMDRRRPIALLEVLRKMWLGIRKGPVQEIWVRNKYINADNFAFLKGKSTSLPILIKKFALEDAKYFNKPIATLDVDLSKAYDKVPYHIKEMALRRFNLPEEGIGLWSAYDSKRRVRIRTPFGLSDAFHPECGAFAQGAEESCIGFVSLMSWASDFIDEHGNSEPYEINTSAETTAPLNKTLFCDDTAAMSKSAEGMQQTLDAMTTFMDAVQMDINYDKTFWVPMNIDNPPALHFHSTTPAPSGQDPWARENCTLQAVPMKSDTDIWRYLGHFQHNQGSTKTTQDNILAVLQEDLAYTASRPMTSQGKKQAIETLIYSKVVYQTKHSSLSKENIDSYQTQISKALKNGLHISRSTANDLLYGAEAGGGIAAGHLWDRTHQEKLHILMEMLYSDVPAARAAVANSLFRLGLESKTAECPLSTPTGLHAKLPPDWWIGSLCEWMSQHDYTIRGLDTFSSLPPRVHDVPLHTAIYDHHISQNQPPGAAARDTNAALAKHNVRWISDLLVPGSHSQLQPRYWLHAPKHKHTQALQASIAGLHRNGLLNTSLGQIYEPAGASGSCSYMQDTAGSFWKVTERGGASRGCRLIPHAVEGRATKATTYTHTSYTLDTTTAALNEGQFKPAYKAGTKQQPEYHAYKPREAGAQCTLPPPAAEHTVHTAPGSADTIDTIVSHYANTRASPICTITSDGSLQQDTGQGTYAWALLLCPDAEDCFDSAGSMKTALSVADGGGCQQLPTDGNCHDPHAMSSTRMEAMAILSCIRHLKLTPIAKMPSRRKGQKITWICDSQPAINTWQKLGSLTTRKWLALPSDDVWREIARELDGTTLRQNIQFQWQTSHVGDDLAFDGLAHPVQCNILADELCDLYYPEVSGIQPSTVVTAPTNVPVLFKADYQVTRRTTAWLQQDAAMERTRRYFQTHPELWGAEDDINWGIMTSVHKRTQFLNQKTMTMKVMHGWLATNHVRFMRGEITADENKCTFCGCSCEDAWHLSGSCTHPDIVKLRRTALAEFDTALSTDSPFGWNKKHVLGAIGLNREGAVDSYFHPSNSTFSPATTEYLLQGGSRPVWHGVFSQSWSALLTGELGQTEAQATKTCGELWKAMWAFHTGLWHARSELLKAREPDHTRATGTSPDEQLTALYKSGALPFDGNSNISKSITQNQCLTDCLKSRASYKKKVLALFSHDTNLIEKWAKPLSHPLVRWKVQKQFGDRDRPFTGIVTHVTNDTETQLFRVNISMVTERSSRGRSCIHTFNRTPSKAMRPKTRTPEL